MANEIILSGDIKNIDNLATVSQLPIITEQLELIRPAIEAKSAELCALDCSEDTVKEVKKQKAEFNKFFSAMEEKRKEIKKAITAPYEEFEKTYNECVKMPVTLAATILTEKVNAVEKQLKDQKEAELKKYYAEYAASLNIDFVPFEKSNIVVTLSESLKSLKTRAAGFLSQIANDVDAISKMEDSAEVMAEYKNTFNLATSIQVVSARHKAIEEEKKRAEARTAAEASQKAREAEIDKQLTESLSAPTVAPTQPTPNAEVVETLKATFTVIGTLEEIKSVKKFIEERGIKYEC